VPTRSGDRSKVLFSFVAMVAALVCGSCSSPDSSPASSSGAPSLSEPTTTHVSQPLDCSGGTHIAFLPFAYQWNGTPAEQPDYPRALQLPDLPSITLTPRTSCSGLLQFDFWVARTRGPDYPNYLSHETTPGLIWDWQDAHGGLPGAYDVRTALQLVWPRVDDVGHTVPVGVYYAYLNVYDPVQHFGPYFATYLLS
jgi:hypothetical protein